MKMIPNSFRRPRKLGLPLAVGGVLLATFAGAYAYRMMSARPGESALSLIPANAAMVGTMDLDPSATQAIAFKRIEDALARNGMTNLVESSLLDALEPTALGKEGLRPLVLRHAAMAVLADDKHKVDLNHGAVILLAVTSGAEAQKVLEKEGVARFYKGLKYFKLKHGSQLFWVVDDKLVVAQDPKSLYAISQVRAGVTKPVTSVESFRAARAQVADDANVMVFVSPAAISDISDGQVDVSSDWTSAGMAVRDGGLGVSMGGAYDTKKAPQLANMGKAEGIRSDLFRVLPSGMYGAMVMSQPSLIIEAVLDTLKDSGSSKMSKRVDENLEKEVGLSYRNDVLPSFQGTTVMSLYPSETPAAGVDALILIDDLHGADPAKAVAKFRDWATKQIAKEGNTPNAFEEQEINGVKYVRLAAKAETDLQKSISDGMKDAPMRKDKKLLAKTLVWATVGKGVLASSSQALLQRAVAAYQTGKDPLSADSSFASAHRDLLDGSQQVGAFSLSRIATGVSNTLDMKKSSEEDRKTFRSIIDAFASVDAPFTLKAKFLPDGKYAGGTFIPLDYDKVLDMAGDLRKRSTGNSSAPTHPQ